MSKVYVFLADGFEEIEALTVVDILRRAGADLQTVSIMESKSLEGRSGIRVTADILFEECSPETADLLVLPGGMPGTKYLMMHSGLREALLQADREKRLIGAICAAPTVLGSLGITEGRRATSYPGMADKLKGCTYVEDEAVVTDGNIVTSRGAGTAMAFSLKLTALLFGEEKASEISRSVVCMP